MMFLNSQLENDKSNVKKGLIFFFYGVSFSGTLCPLT